MSPERENYKRLREAVNDWHDVPPEYESEPVMFHRGWETAIRRVQALMTPKEKN